MRERIGYHPTGSSFLNSIISYSTCCAKRFFYITIVQIFTVMVGPHTRIEICLQLKSYRKFIGLSLAHTLLLIAHLAGSTCNMLHLMPYFMGDNISDRKVSSLCTKTSA